MEERNRNDTNHGVGWFVGEDRYGYTYEPMRTREAAARTGCNLAASADWRQFGNITTRFDTYGQALDYSIRQDSATRRRLSR